MEYPTLIIIGLACVCLTILCVRLYRSKSDLQAQLVDANKDHYDARHDELTGLLNRRGWNEVVHRALRASTTQDSQEIFSERPLSLVFFDLDQFKQINDQHGHGVGDQVLVEFSNRLRSAFGNNSQECVARLGGEEFAVLSWQAQEELNRAVERFREELLIKPIVVSEVQIKLRCSVGIAGEVKGEEPGAWLIRADKAMYESKHQRGTRFD